MNPVYGIVNLFISDALTAQNAQLLRQSGVKTVISVGREFAETPNHSGMIHHRIPVWDTPGEAICRHFDSACRWIETGLARGAVLVHCQMGVSRSASIVLAYMMKTKNIELKAALGQLRISRKIVNPNAGFVRQLNLWRLFGGREVNIMKVIAPCPRCQTFALTMIGVCQSCGYL